MRRLGWVLAGFALSVLWEMAMAPYVLAIVTDPHMEGSPALFVTRVLVFPIVAIWLAVGLLLYGFNWWRHEINGAGHPHLPDAA